jgi:hypothetical protein
MDPILFEFILYVSDQKKSSEFYAKLLSKSPVLDVPGMTEFELSPTCKLGLMPEDGISKIIEEKTQHPAKGNGIPRCELYIIVANILPYYTRAKQLNAIMVSDISDRDWGDKVCYFSDMDGHIIAFAQKNTHKQL